MRCVSDNRRNICIPPIKSKPSEIIYTDIVSDEFHNPIRTRNIQLLDQMDRDKSRRQEDFYCPALRCA